MADQTEVRTLSDDGVSGDIPADEAARLIELGVIYDCAGEDDCYMLHFCAGYGWGTIDRLREVASS